MERQAPKIFQITGKWRVPTVSLVFSALPGLLAFMSVKVSSNTVCHLTLERGNVRYLIFYNHY